MKFLYFLLFPVFLAAQQLPFQQDTIARNERFNNREFAVYDASGKIHLTYTGQHDVTSSTREIYYVNENNDGSFTTTNITNNSVDDNYSTLSIDSNNKLHCVFEGRDPNNFQVKYTNNVNGSFGAPIYLTTGGLNKATPFSKVGPDTVLHVLYYTYTSGQDNVYYRSFRLRDSLLSPEMTISTAEASGDFESALDIDASGKVHIVVNTGNAWGGPLKYFTITSGVLSEVNTGITATVTVPRVVIDKQQNPVILYRNEGDGRLYVTKRSGGTFTSPVAITPYGQYPANYQNFAIDDSNYIYVIYQSSQAASGKGFYLVYGKDNNFSDTIRVSGLTPEYVTMNSSHVLAKGKGEIAFFYAPAGMRNGLVACDIFMQRGNVFNPTPVELTSFTEIVDDKSVVLNWSTASEKNNYGFDVERKSSNRDWQKIAFVNGRGTTVNSSSYSYTDALQGTGKYSYRLKQIDMDGSFIYSNTIEVEKGIPGTFVLEQNYPNPFNPSTTISYSLPLAANVHLTLYDVLGNEAAVLVNENKPAGHYSIQLDAARFNLASGVYLYKLQAGEFTQTKKLTLLK